MTEAVAIATNNEWEMGWDLRGFNGTMRKARIRLGLTQKQLGKLVGTSNSTIGQIESFRNKPTDEVASKIASQLGIRQEEVWPPWMEPRGSSIRLVRYQKMDEATFSLTSKKVKEEVAQLSYDASEEVERSDFIEALKPRLAEMLSSLSFRERGVLECRFGLKDGEHYTLYECARIFGITRERLRQIEIKALNKLRNQSRVAKVSRLAKDAGLPEMVALDWGSGPQNYTAREAERILREDGDYVTVARPSQKT